MEKGGNLMAKVDACLHAISTVHNASVLFESAARMLYAEDMGTLRGMMFMHAQELREFLDKLHEQIEAQQDMGDDHQND